MYYGALRWRALAAMWGGGAVIGTISLILPHAPGADDGVLWANTALAYVTAAAAALLAHRLPHWLNHACLGAGTAVITTAILASGDAASYYAIWYVWVALYAFCFYGRRAACLHMASVGAAYAGALVVESSPAAEGRWLTTIATTVIAAVFVDKLVRALRRHAEAAEVAAGRLEAMSRTDDMTGLPNRRSWDHELARTIAHARRFDLGVCVALLDLDGFKQLNDDHGHRAGDDMLAAVALIWSNEVRDVDTLARWGGDEFALLIPGADLAAATEAVERVRLVTPAGITCSGGVVRWDGQEDEAALMARADEALYRAKRGGRDRLAVRDEPAATPA
jgi:diguanylate cyclase (GGDEF)-like protein